MTEESKDTTIEEAKIAAKKLTILTANRWKHRRRMAYIALICIIYVTYQSLYYIPQERLGALEEIITWFFITMGSIIGAYVGFSTLDDKWKDKSGD